MTCNVFGGTLNSTLVALTAALPKKALNERRVHTNGNSGTNDKLQSERTVDEDSCGVVEQWSTQRHCPDQPRHQVVDSSRYLVKRPDRETTVLHKIVVDFVLHRYRNKIDFTYNNRDSNN